MTEHTKSTSEVLALCADGPMLLDFALGGISETDLDLAISAASWSIR